MLIFPVPKDLDKLLEYGRMTAITPLSELCRIVIVAVHLILVFIVAVLSAENRGAYGASEMLNMVFAVQSCDIRPAKGPSTCITKQL